MTWKRIWIPLALLCGVIAGGVALNDVALASAPHRGDYGRHANTLHVALVRAFVCDGVLETVTNLETLVDGQWQFTQDDGREDIQVERMNGTWSSVGSASGGEARRRWTGYGDATDLTGAARIIRTDSGITSTQQLIGVCPYLPRES